MISKSIQKTISLALLIITLAIGCSQSGKVDKSKADTNLVIGLVAGLTLKEFVLNGRWNSFTGNSTTGNTIQTFSARANDIGLMLTDSTDFGGYSSCSILNEFDNGNGSYIFQNPENNGACFAGDTNKGKYFKTVFFKNTEKDNSYWYCTLNFPGVATLELARAVSDTSTKTSPGTSGCGSSAWSRLDKR
jgi:hypothetical protein